MSAEAVGVVATRSPPNSSAALWRQKPDFQQASIYAGIHVRARESPQQINSSESLREARSRIPELWLGRRLGRRLGRPNKGCVVWIRVISGRPVDGRRSHCKAAQLGESASCAGGGGPQKLLARSILDEEKIFTQGSRRLLCSVQTMWHTFAFNVSSLCTRFTRLGADDQFSLIITETTILIHRINP